MESFLQGNGSSRRLFCISAIHDCHPDTEAGMTRYVLPGMCHCILSLDSLEQDYSAKVPELTRFPSVSKNPMSLPFRLTMKHDALPSSQDSY